MKEMIFIRCCQQKIVQSFAFKMKTTRNDCNCAVYMQCAWSYFLKPHCQHIHSDLDVVVIAIFA